MKIEIKRKNVTKYKVERISKNKKWIIPVTTKRFIPTITFYKLIDLNEENIVEMENEVVVLQNKIKKLYSKRKINFFTKRKLKKLIKKFNRISRVPCCMTQLLIWGNTEYKKNILVIGKPDKTIRSFIC